MKKISFVFLILSLFSFSLLAQEADLEAEVEITADNETEFEDEFDDFDSIFDDAQDIEEPVAAEEPVEKAPVQIITSAFSSMVHFSGTFTGDVGLLYVLNKNDEIDDKPTGYFSLKNTLNMLVKPSNIFVIHGSLETGLSNNFSMNVSSLYFDYLLFDHLYITAGKKSISWGNLRLFNDSDYYMAPKSYFVENSTRKLSNNLYCTGPRYVDIFAEDAGSLSLELRYPWSFGTITFAITGDKTDSLEPDDMNYYGSIEMSILNTNINLFAKRPEKTSGKDVPAKRKNNLVGLELKRTIFGFDTYMQTIARIKNLNKLTSSEGYQYIVATAGLYRLWDSFDPNVGFNIEYQHEYNTETPERHYDRLAFEGGVKRLGKKNNIKIGVMSHFNITEKHGYTGLTFIVSGICPYADWTNKCALGYGSKYDTPIFMISSAISLTLDY